MNAVFRAERIRVLSNYARLFASLLIGLVVTRLLLQGGEWLFSVYTLITVGMGVSIMLTELLRLGSVPLLGASVSEGKVINAQKFDEDLSAAFAISLVGALIGAAGMIILGWMMLRNLGSLDLNKAAWLFLASRIAMMVVAVTLTPAMAVLLVSGRQPAFNFFLFLERLGEFIGVAIPLWFLAQGTNSEADHLVQIGVGVAVCTIAVYIAATVSAFASSSAVSMKLSLPKVSVLVVMLKRVGWSSLQILSSNLYVRVDILIVAVFLGPTGTVALGIAIRLMGYVRQATNGLISGLDAIFANLDGQRQRQNSQAQKGDAIGVRLLSLSTSLQGGVVFQLAALLLLLREKIVHLWVGDLLGGADAENIVGDIALLSALMVIGIGFRSLNLGWMSAMTGRGLAKQFTPWLMPGAIGNATVLVAWGLFAPETFTVITVGWVFLGFQLITHGLIIPVVSARSLECPLRSLVKPLLVPLAIAIASFFTAHILKSLLDNVSSGLGVLAVVIIVFTGLLISVFVSVRHGIRE